jgi:hypothetical protein
MRTTSHNENFAIKRKNAYYAKHDLNTNILKNTNSFSLFGAFVYCRRISSPLSLSNNLYEVLDDNHLLIHKNQSVKFQ